MIKDTKLLNKDNSLKTKITKGIFWSFLGTFISKGFMLLAFIFIARIITIEEYGEVSLIRNTILTFAAISVMSFGVTATKYLALYKDTNLAKAERILTFTRLFVLITSFLVSCFIFLFSELISIKMLDNQGLSDMVKLSSIAIFFTALNGYQNGLLAGLEKFKEISFINMLNGLLTLPLLVILSYKWAVLGVVIGILIISFLTWLISAYYVRLSMKESSLSYRVDNLKKEFKIIKEFTIPSFLSGLSVAPAILLANLIILQQEDGYYQLGIFNAAYFYTVITATLNVVIGQVIYPYAMQQFGKDNKKFEYFNIISPWVIGIVINIPLIIFPELMIIAFGTQYNTEDFKISVIIVALFSIIIAHRQGIARNFAAANLMWWSVLGNGFWGILLIISTYFLSSYGTVGLSFAFLIAYLINSIVFLPLYLYKNLIKKELLFAKPLILIWLSIFSSTILYILKINIFVKVLALIFIFTFISFLFLYLWRSYNEI